MPHDGGIIGLHTEHFLPDTSAECHMSTRPALVVPSTSAPVGICNRQHCPTSSCLMPARKVTG